MPCIRRNHYLHSMVRDALLLSTWCFVSSISTCFSWSETTIKIKRRLFYLWRSLYNTASVNSGPIIFEWLIGSPAPWSKKYLTEIHLGSPKIPFCKVTTLGMGIPMSVCSSLKMFTSDGGKVTPLDTEKRNQAPGDPEWILAITTFTFSKRRFVKALKIRSPGLGNGFALRFGEKPQFAGNMVFAEFFAQREFPALFDLYIHLFSSSVWVQN